MAERKSVNKYYPPDWDPSKGSVNNYVGQHPLRDRAKKLGQGILVIRFELPYNIWCGGCNAHVGMGVRYNAEKSKTGNYYSTPIYKFRMKCHLCDNYFEIQTDPKNHDYVILNGARRKEQRWDPKENEQIVPEDKATQKKMATDAMFKLEHGSDDVKRGQKVKSNLGQLELRREDWKDDYLLNKLARHKFREEKKSRKSEEASDAALLSKSSLEIPLVEESAQDVKIAGLMKYRTLDSFDEKRAQKRQAIEDRPLFSGSKKARTDTDSGETHKLDILKQQIRKGKAAKVGGAPFDRMAMNSLSPASVLTQNKLGIRRKSKDSSSASWTSSSTETSLDDLEDSAVKDDGVKDGANALLSQSGASPSNGDAPDCESRLTGNDNGDLVSNECDKISNCMSANDSGESVIQQSSNGRTAGNISDCNIDNGTATAKEVQNVPVVLSASSGLGLVSAYSDSDTDSNAS